MSRKLSIVTRRDWNRIVTNLDGDLKIELAIRLAQFVPAPNVAYYESETGCIDGDSSPYPTSEDIDD